MSAPSQPAADSELGNSNGRTVWSDGVAAGAQLKGSTPPAAGAAIHAARDPRHRRRTPRAPQYIGVPLPKAGTRLQRPRTIRRRLTLGLGHPTGAGAGAAGLADPRRSLVTLRMLRLPGPVASRYLTDMLVVSADGFVGLRPRKGALAEINFGSRTFTWGASARFPWCWAEFFAACWLRGDQWRNLPQRQERRDCRQHAPPLRPQ
jgi:hypothetical protein